MTNRNYNSINDANNSDALVIYQLADYEAGSSTNYGIITDSLEYAKQKANQLASDGDISIIEYKRESADDEFESGEEVWSTKEVEKMTYKEVLNQIAEDSRKYANDEFELYAAEWRDWMEDYLDEPNRDFISDEEQKRITAIQKEGWALSHN